MRSFESKDNVLSEWSLSLSLSLSLSVCVCVCEFVTNIINNSNSKKFKSATLNIHHMEILFETFHEDWSSSQCTEICKESLNTLWPISRFSFSAF